MSLAEDSGGGETQIRAVERTPLRSVVRELCGVDDWACVRLGADLRFAEADTVFRRRFGDEVVGRGLAAVVHPGFVEQLRARLAGLVAGEVDWLRHSTVMLGRDRAPVIVEVTAVAVGGTPADVVLAVRPEQGERQFESPALPVRLSELNARVLEHVAAGMSSAQLARMLFLSKQGVEYHVSTLVRKLGAANRTGMVSMAYATGVLLARQWPPKVNPPLIM